MPAQGRTRTSHSSAPHPPAEWFRLAMLAGCVTACAGWVYVYGQAGQSGQPAQSASGSSQQAHAVQQPTPAQAQPMVMGEGPDSGDDSDSPPSAPPARSVPPAPAAFAPTPAPPAFQPAPRSPAAQPAMPAPEMPIHIADAGGDQARQQINNQCADLLKLTNELKAEVDKTTKDVLSVTVVRKANDIEMLAHQVRDEMRPEVGKN